MMVLDPQKDEVASDAAADASVADLLKMASRKSPLNGEKPVQAAFQISVLVTAYRRPHQLREALQSLAIQDRSLIGEIVVGDDSPADEAKANQAVIEASELRPLIRYFHHSPSLGAYPNHWFLGTEARFSHLMFLHDDDALCPGAIASLVTACEQERDPEVRLWFGRNIIMDVDGKVDPTESDAHNVRYGRSGPGSVRQLWEWCLHEAVTPNSFLVHADDYRSLMRGTRDGNVGDFGFVVRLANTGARARFIAKDMFFYRVQAASSTSSGRGVDVHRAYEISTSLQVPPEFESMKRRRFDPMALTATVRHARDGERREAWKLYWSDAWTWRQRLSMRGFAVLAMILTPRVTWNWALSNRA